MLPHPFRRTIQCPPLDLLNRSDLIEVLNARSTKKSNILAKSLSLSHKIKPIAGSDAHTPYEVGRAYVIFRNSDITYENMKKELMSGVVSISGSELPDYLRLVSHGISTYKNKGFKGLVNSVYRKVIGGQSR